MRFVSHESFWEDAVGEARGTRNRMVGRHRGGKMSDWGRIGRIIRRMIIKRQLVCCIFKREYASMGVNRPVPVPFWSFFLDTMQEPLDKAIKDITYLFHFLRSAGCKRL